MCHNQTAVLPGLVLWERVQKSSTQNYCHDHINIMYISSYQDEEGNHLQQPSQPNVLLKYTLSDCKNNRQCSSSGFGFDTGPGGAPVAERSSKVTGQPGPPKALNFVPSSNVLIPCGDTVGK